MGKKVLVIGSGGREHALTRKLSESLVVEKVYCLPGNGGTKLMKGKVENVPIIEKLEDIVQFARDSLIDLVCIGPEQPLVDGLCDLMNEQNIPCVGPSRNAAVLESSKAWSKEFMQRNNLPTARFSNFQDLDAALQYLDTVDYNIVIKASGLAAGKGVVLPNSREEARQTIIDMMKNNRFGSAGQEIVIEERLVGEEVSILAFCDGTTAVCMPAAQDHKRVFDNDQGPNTGGMGAYAPARVFTTSSPALKQQCWDLVQRTISCLATEGIPYQGILYAGFMLTANGPMILEYNCRFGDPETQVLLPLLSSDLYSILLSCVKGNLQASQVQWKENLFASTVICASGGYPDSYQKGFPIEGLDKIKGENIIVYHSGTQVTSEPNQVVLSNGGRVLSITGLGNTLRDAVAMSYEAIQNISFSGMQYRRDIAHRALNAPLRIGVLGSTRGTDMQAIINAIQNNTLANVVISVCISNKKDSGILERARQHGIPAVHIGAAQLSREEHDCKVTSVLEEYGVELVLLIGYMRIVSSKFTNHWRWRVINVHPSLLPEFAGGMDVDVHSAVLAAKKEITGCTIHYLTEVVDGGPIILQKKCPVNLLVDTPDTLKARVQELEGEAFIEVIQKFRDNEIGPHFRNGLPNQHAITYKGAGVDIDAGEALVDRIKPFCKSTRRLGCNAELGGFGALFDLQQAGLSGNSDTVLVSGADGVGTKLIVAQKVGKHDTVGIDLVAMNANDIVVCGAQPLFFLDYYACGRLDVDVAAQVVSGIAEGCRQAGAALIGGETAEMSGMYSNEEYDLAGFCVGAVSRSKVLPNFSSMRSSGDILIGLRSSGLHSNGYSLVRKCVEKSGLSWSDPAPFQPELSLGEALLCPTRIYVKSILALTKLDLVKGMAHITGGGFPENIPRMLTDELMAVVDVAWPIPPLFKWIQEVGDISTYEMMRTLNCGIGMVLLVAEESKDQVIEILRANGEEEEEPVLLGFTTLRPHINSPQVLIRGEF